MPWTLSKRFPFEAAHHLPHHAGKCQRVHGHSWALSVEVQAMVLVTSGPETGMVMDYGRITAAVRPLLDATLDHYDLNVSTGLESPTSETLARWIYERLAPTLPGLHAVTIEETCTSACRYTAKDAP